jgi:hypothetical protein
MVCRVRRCSSPVIHKNFFDQPVVPTAIDVADSVRASCRSRWHGYATAAFTILGFALGASGVRGMFGRASAARAHHTPGISLNLTRFAYSS